MIVGDDIDAIAREIRLLSQTYDILITSGAYYKLNDLYISSSFINNIYEK